MRDEMGLIGFTFDGILSKYFSSIKTDVCVLLIPITFDDVYDLKLSRETKDNV